MKTSKFDPAIGCTLRQLIVCSVLWLLQIGPASAGPDRTLPWVSDEVKAAGIVFRRFDSQIIAGTVSYHLYRPAHASQPETRLPVLYWLHGTEGGVKGIRPLAQFFDEAIRAGTIPPMMVVFVNGLPRRLWADAKDGTSPVESVFIREVIADVDTTFPTIAKREARLLEGFSMGGFGAARLGFKYPQLFAGISILAGGPLDPAFQGPRAQQNPQLREQILREVCANDLSYFKAISPWTEAITAPAALRAQKTLIRQAVGQRDVSVDQNRAFHDHLATLNIAHDYFEVPAVGHDSLALLTALGPQNGRFYRQALGLQ